jgi:predicted acetyltransferase
VAPRIDWLPRERLEDWVKCDASAFHYLLEPGDLAMLEKSMPVDRCQAAFDGDEIVSTACVFPFEMTVPGGALPMAGVSWVSVKATHRRQGVASDMMRFQLNDIRERGEPLASLFASESIIYGRFGYGLSSQAVEWTIDRRNSGLEPGPAPRGRFRMVTEDDAKRDWPAFFDSVRLAVPGFYSRSDVWWQHQRFYNDEKSKARFWVQYEVAGSIAGYLYYRVDKKDEHHMPASDLQVIELMAVDDEAYVALWRYVFGVDLIKTITAGDRPPDEPLLHMLADPRRLVRTPGDALWVRMVDTEAALAGRRYRREGSLVIDVTDRFLEWGNGRFLLEGGPDGATCTPTTREPDLRMGIRDLGAAYMGETRFTNLARAGRVEGDRASLLRADEMFDWDPKPWCPEGF